MANVIVSGPVHVGKTTALRGALAWFRGNHWRIAGFLTSPLWGDGGDRCGLEVEDLSDGTMRTLARTDRPLGGAQVGPYSFDPRVTEWADGLVDRAIAQGCDLVVVDEIGRLELEMGAGFQRTLCALQKPLLQPVLVVVRESLLQSFCSRMPGFASTVVFLTLENRDMAPSRIVEAARGEQPVVPGDTSQYNTLCRCDSQEGR